ncbi:MAG: hypothetical protein RMK91_06305 [Pseudanabaenaceae cyanobacterium SKYGB_i_bin29]|nr:hypothetical protein [Pseudanabaenaceae cyanobacterium SKYG29]MDW8421463.1 hypothetical protein [Pseudanabaenaceae cyanobacterium SKYGB_i_bin29]
MTKRPIDVLLGKVYMEMEHLTAQIHANSQNFRKQFDNICVSLEPLKHTLLDLDTIFVSSSPSPDTTALDFDRLQFFSKSDGVAELLSNPLLDAETIEEFRWKFFYYETKLEALSLEIQKLQNRSVKPGISIDDLIRNWLNPPERILAEYRDILEEKRALRQQIREELVQNSNLARKYISHGLQQIYQFFRDIETKLPQNQQLKFHKSDHDPYHLLAELNLLKKEDYLTFWCSYYLNRSVQIVPSLQENWFYLKKTGSHSVELHTLLSWIKQLLTTYATSTNLINAKLVIYDKLTDRERVYNLP